LRDSSQPLGSCEHSRPPHPGLALERGAGADSESPRPQFVIGVYPYFVASCRSDKYAPNRPAFHIGIVPTNSVQDSRLKGEVYGDKATVDSIDSNVMRALEDHSLWSGARPQTAIGDVAVRADELANKLELPIGVIHDSLERLESRGRISNIGGHLSDPTPRWHTLRRR
jgi:hypothetical protein